MTEGTTADDSVVAIYDSHVIAEDAVKALQQAGLDMTRLSIIGKGFHTEEHVVGFYTTTDRMRVWGNRGLFWGGLWGMLVGGGFFLIPPIGGLVVLGPLLAWIVGALEGAAVGATAGVIGAALSSIGIPKDSVLRYELAVKAGQFVVIVQGSPEIVTHARFVLGTTKALELNSHSTALALQ